MANTVMAKLACDIMENGADAEAPAQISRLGDVDPMIFASSRCSAFYTLLSASNRSTRTNHANVAMLDQPWYPKEAFARCITTLIAQHLV